ncbi:MAG: bifunctional (p)ppGpp synthetase/guanosine-3',5'-bis(diphosphate) 3'-pyrophosphohydrolase [Cytophagales bacterium]|nr:bifunctional (p)ppGpp synthetase/guanosine-3',5'-bis(diphosphate) 3'-pyrophosphohydrolase [Cytophagales bacterium]
MLNIDTELEKKEILRRYRTLLRHAKPILKADDVKIIKKAFYTSMEAHKEMRRKSGEPYIFHPLATAEIVVKEIGLGTTSIVSALLHDVVEDTDLEIEDIERMFGKKVARIIDGLTKISGVFEYGTSQQAENFRKMLLTLSDDVRVILVKIADRLHNMRTLVSMPRNKQLKIASETIYIYAPLAHRLGLYSIKSELEDLHLKHTQPDIYKQIDEKIRKSKDVRDRFIRYFTAPIQTEIKKANLDVRIKGRPKSIYSIFSKMSRQNITFEEVFDKFAIRIIINNIDHEYEKAACWQVYSIVSDFYKPNPDRLRDWISTSRANGYESLHTTVMSKTGQWVEVQIRTSRMDDIAEKGYAAHWKYKAAGNLTNESGLDQWLNKVRETLEHTDSSALDFLNDFRTNLFNEEVFIFTPQGELRILPQGATTLDFAFDIHTQIGTHCLGAKVNQKLVPLSYALKNGDQVEILTSKKQRPNEDWLQFVTTSKARTKIKADLKKDKKDIASLGKEIVKRKLKQVGKQLNDQITNLLSEHFNLENSVDFFYRVAKGTIDPKTIKKVVEFKGKQAGKRSKQLMDGKSFEQQIKKTRGVSSDMLMIGDSLEKIDYTLSKCCNPIRGDDVFGFITVSEGIKIHRASCPNAIKLMSNFGYRIVKAKWTSQQELAFLAGLKIKGTDRVGLIKDVTDVISNELKVNMRSITVDSDDGIFDGTIMLFVYDTKHLDKLIKKLKKVNSVFDVTRFDN